MDSLIYDRSTADCEHARELKAKVLSSGWISLTPEEQQEWLAGLRGCPNYTDLNRMISWLEYLSSNLNKYGYAVALEHSAMYKPSDLVYQEDLDRIKRNVNKLRDAFFAFPEWRDLVFENSPTLEQYNAIEWNLHLCDYWLELLIKSFFYSGEIYAGEV